MSPSEDGGAVEGHDLVADLVKRPQTDPFHRPMTSLGDALAFRAAAAEIPAASVYLAVGVMIYILLWGFA